MARAKMYPEEKRMTTRTDFTKSKTIENRLSPQEVDRFKKAAKDLCEVFLVYVLLYTGMRVSEVVHMKLSWVNFDRGIITIPESQPCRCQECKAALYNRKGKMTKPADTWKPKTSSSARVIPVVPEVEDVLKSFFSKHKVVMDVVPSRGSAYHTLKVVARRAGIKHPVFPHALRGTFATMLAVKKFGVFELKDALGWKTIAPAEFYVRLAGEEMKQVFKEKW